MPKSKFLTWPFLLSLLLRLILGSILLYAAIKKWQSGPYDFAVIMANFQILPAILVPLFSVALLGAETLLGIGLIIGVWQKQIVWLTVILFFTFSTAMTSALARGLNTNCGCFGDKSSTVGLKTLVIDDLIPLGLSVILLLLSYKIASQRLAEQASS